MRISWNRVQTDLIFPFPKQADVGVPRLDHWMLSYQIDSIDTRLEKIFIIFDIPNQNCDNLMLAIRDERPYLGTPVAARFERFGKGKTKTVYKSLNWDP